ncbi:LysR family transcriptional regulator [Actinomadura hibisca]|uniref:LysR family transcriptional regulator n=1 Tax=Actinomadura hibisca TaxID=68565 RepID=UPI00083264AA|nr:LysR family transcriptional regulator [Actinomadura hibisca]
MLDPVRLRLLRDLAEHGTMTAVGEVAGMSSSAVSQHLARLEQETGVRLFRRVGRRVELTAEGHRLVGHAHTVLNALEAAEKDLREADVPRGPVHVASFATAVARYLLPAVGTAKARHPQLRIVVHEAEPAEAIAALRAGRCDMAITYTYNLLPEPSPAGLNRQHLCEEPFLVALPSDHPAARAEVDLRDLAEEQWIAGSRGTGDHQLIERAAALAGFHPDISHTADDYALILHMVRHGLGVALVPEGGIGNAAADLVFRPVADLSLARGIEVLTRHVTPAVQAVRDLLHDTATSADGR